MTSNDSSTTIQYVDPMNDPATLLGFIITFQVIAWLAVLFRLYARFKLAHSPGWDDVWVVLACISVTIGTGFVSQFPKHGLGQHVWDLDTGVYGEYLHTFWNSSLSYFASTTLIKVSLLVQYLRLFKTKPVLHGCCVGLIVIVSLWGTTYFFLLMFSCWPVYKWWTEVPGHCFLFGTGKTDPVAFYVGFISHTGANMAFDAIVLLFPLTGLSSSDFQGRRRAGIAGLLFMGCGVVIISAIRVAALVRTHAGLWPIPDPTFVGSTGIALSCLEVDVAILCASVPVFWPIISSLSFDRIFVTNEVIVRSEQRLSRSADSETELRTYHSLDSASGNGGDVRRHYKDPYVMDMVRPIHEDGDGGGTHVAHVGRGDAPV
ncbi:uncharacterized protein K452DRAFT_40256 [Aplosporella prunicola CBS 121167]|uniref:Rhodopsin domain-containing protein n=1 Tax=Aplosporella prunicola CBS 121167 TaxID=1176127 RepID=A0A6A6BD41_9PEZI|nr:uncharacterized protein K452DRAFT_40256 [Aplosporella prunicola CBS 121167]KAF2141498.1 hypothetical protein K452DRAFT_40256 [Aplosporella prunicola CBS 121167]